MSCCRGGFQTRPCLCRRTQLPVSNPYVDFKGLADPREGALPPNPRHSRERRPLHNRHTGEGRNPEGWGLSRVVSFTTPDIASYGRLRKGLRTRESTGRLLSCEASHLARLASPLRARMPRRPIHRAAVTRSLDAARGRPSHGPARPGGGPTRQPRPLGVRQKHVELQLLRPRRSVSRHRQERPHPLADGPHRLEIAPRVDAVMPPARDDAAR